MVRASEPVRWGVRPASTNSLVAVATVDPSASSSRTLAEKFNQVSAPQILIQLLLLGSNCGSIILYFSTSVAVSGQFNGGSFSITGSGGGLVQLIVLLPESVMRSLVMS